MDIDPPAGQTTTDDAGAAPPSQQAVLLMGPGNAGPTAGMQGRSPAGWIATQPATQRTPLVSPSQREFVEIEDALRRPSSPPTGTEDAPMDIDDWEEPKSRKRSSKSKRSKARHVDSPGFRPPWTQADPTTPPRAGSKHKPHSSPEKSPRTEKRQAKMARRDAERRRLPGTDSEDDLDIGAIARIKQEGEPSRVSSVDKQSETRGPRAHRRPTAVPDDGEDFTSLIADLSDLSGSDQQSSSDEDPLAAKRVHMSQSATAQPREHVPKVNLPLLVLLVAVEAVVALVVASRSFRISYTFVPLTRASWPPMLAQSTAPVLPLPAWASQHPKSAVSTSSARLVILAGDGKS
ncbi:hypothetical protein PTI98_005657 [Pleurotus ostreatus]|nr:hypothetical protein PTI98_009377 [Pleurotus ostreatus]KAJ8699018.1 hypothetical protein PTI98_005657 [Pleurotus ostreatus]